MSELDMTDESGAAARPVRPAGGATATRHLVIVHQPGWQSLDDWRDIAGRVGRVDPSIRVFIVPWHQTEVELTQRAAELPSLVVSAGPLGVFKPLRGKVFHGQMIPKFMQLQRLAAAGVPVPQSMLLQPGVELDPAQWGEFVVVKPTDLKSSSHGKGVQLMRTARVRYIAPEDYPEDHPGRKAPMLVQQFVDTGDQISSYRVLTFFGEPIYCMLTRSNAQRPPLTTDDATLEAADVAIQGVSNTKSFVYDADVVALARAAHFVFPQVPLKGCDILRNTRTGQLYVLELNPGGNTWHFSSNFMAKRRAEMGPEFERQRREHIDAFGTAAQVLVEMTRRYAE